MTLATTAPDHRPSPDAGATAPSARHSSLPRIALGVGGQLAQLALVLLAVSALTFLLLNALPGSAADARIGPLPNFSPEERAQLTATFSKQLGLDRSLLYQYFIWVKDALSGNFGLTYQGLEVRDVVGARLGATIELGIASVVFSVVGSVVVSMLAFRSRFRVVRGGLQAFTTVLLVLPAFWLGLMLVIVFAAELGWLPSAGYVPVSDGFSEHLKVLILPTLTLALPQMALFFRYLNAGLRDTAGTPFVTASRARGPRRAVDRLSARAPERRVADAHGRRARRRVADQRPRHRRVGVQLARHGPAARRQRQDEGLQHGRRDRADHRRHLRRGRLRRRHPLPSARPAHQAGRVTQADASAGRTRRVVAFVRRQPGPLIAGVVLLTPFLLFCIVPGLFAPHDPLRIEAIPLEGPSRTYWLGTDEVGRDLLSRSIYAARNDVLVSLASAFIAFTLGTTIGLFSGYVGGKVDTVMMRVVDVLLSFPTIVLALFLIVVIGREQWVQVLAIALVMMPSMARFSRGTGLVLRNRGYVEAARLAGASRRHVLRHHVLPNSLPTLLVAASVLAASAVLISASLSYLGLGAQPPDPSWGNMLRSAYSVVYEAPLYGLGPGVCVTIVAGAYILIGEGLRRKYRADGFVAAAGARAGTFAPAAGALG